MVRSRRGHFCNPGCAGSFIENKNIRKCAANIDTDHEAAHWVPFRQSVGDNYLAQPLGPEWPATPAPQDIAKAFDGEVFAAIDLYGQVCPNAVILDGADDSDSWRKTMRRVAMTGGAVAVYLNRDVSDAETDGQGVRAAC